MKVGWPQKVPVCSGCGGIIPMNCRCERDGAARTGRSIEVLPTEELRKKLDDLIFDRREAEHHSGMAHDGETTIHCEIADALEKARDSLLGAP